MRSHRVLIAAIGAVFTLSCATRVPRPAGVPPGAAYVTWIIMSGNRDNPDQDFVCQSDRKDECVIPVSRPDAQVFSDVHFYYHAERADTTYAGSMEVGFFQGPIASRSIAVSTTVKKSESIGNHSITGIVSATPGEYAIQIGLTATAADVGQSQPILEQVRVTLK